MNNTRASNVKREWGARNDLDGAPLTVFEPATDTTDTDTTNQTAGETATDNTAQATTTPTTT